MLRQYQLDPNRVHVCSNAIAPGFAGQIADADTFARQKSAAPILAYTSTPFRGLDILLDVFERLHKRVPASRLQVYSSMGIYFAEEKDDPYRELYARCRLMSGAEYVGALAQPKLAEALKPAWILAYPNTFVETSCIAVMEAMACGMHVVTSGLGALPETTSGLGTLLPPLRGEEDRGRFVDGFVEGLAGVIEEASRDLQKFWAGKWRQASAMRSQCTWAVRAAQWEQLLLGLLQAPGSPR